MEDFWNQHLSNVTTIIKNCTVMLLDDTMWNKKEEIELKLIGTGVLIQFQNNYFLLSAAHVIDHFHKKNIQPRIALEQLSNIMFQPGGTIYKNTTALRDKDTIDIAFLLLDTESVEEISKHYTFLKEDNLAIEHKFFNQEPYVFYGYPSTTSKEKYDKSYFQSVPFMHVTTPLLQEQYFNFDRHPDYNVITSYDKHNSFSLKAKVISNGPDLHGISGCGMWFIDPTNISSGYMEPKLTAIMTDWSLQNSGYIIGTRINVITHNIKKILATINDFKED